MAISKYMIHSNRVQMPLMSSRPDPHWDRREMMELMRRKEEEHRKREEELRLQRERERLKFEREKLEREKLELQQLRMAQQQTFIPAYGSAPAASAYAASTGRRSLADAVGSPFMSLDSGVVGAIYGAGADRSRSGPVRADDRNMRPMETRYTRRFYLIRPCFLLEDNAENAPVFSA